jgi:hypothetical protein
MPSSIHGGSRHERGSCRSAPSTTMSQHGAQNSPSHRSAAPSTTLSSRSYGNARNQSIISGDLFTLIILCVVIVMPFIILLLYLYLAIEPEA